MGRLVFSGRHLGRLWWLILAVLSIPALRPLAVFGVTRSFDGETHLLRLALLDYHIRQGTLFPRWLPELILGKGAPIFTYYAPLTYYLAEALHLAGLNYNAALAATMGLLVVLAGWGAFLLARDVFAQRSLAAAGVAATAYMYAPYLLTNVYIRAGLGEVGALAVLPWVFWSTRRLLCAPKPELYVVPLFFSLSGLVLSHNITLLLAVPMLAGYAVALSWRQQRSTKRMGLLAVAVAAAAGATAFFWAPVVFERDFLTTGVYKVAREIFIPRNVWRWHNFLDTSFPFLYSTTMPVRLGLVPLVLALTGAILARRRDPEWLFFIVVATAAGLAAGAWALPLWLNSPALQVVQFPWRLLSLMSLPMALLTGGIVVSIRRPVVAWAVAGLLIGLVVLAGAPRVEGFRPLAPVFADLSPAKVARYEKVTGDLGGSAYTGEFTPRWVHATSNAVESQEPQSRLEVALRQADALSWRGRVASQAGESLRFTSFYFPGWQARLDNGIPLRTYPSGYAGLLTIDLPPGDHEFSVTYAGTALERWATIGSLLALAGLTCAIAIITRRRGLVLAPLAVLLGAAAFFYWPSRAEIIQAPATAVEADGTRLLGYRVVRSRPDSVTIFPYWFVARPAQDLRMRWQLRDDQERVIAELTQAPYYDTAATAEWSTGTLANDAVELTLPAVRQAGRYKLYVQVETPRDAGVARYAGPVELSQAKPRVQPGPMHPRAAQFGQGMVLEGFDLEINGKPASGSEIDRGTLVVQPGDVLQYTLFWRAAGPIPKNYRARVEIVDRDGIGVSGEERVAGGFLNEPTTWNPNRVQSDAYQVIVPPQASPETYDVQMRVYDPDLSTQLEVAGSDGTNLGEHLTLHSTKVVAKTTRQPQHVMAGQIGEVASFLGFDLSPEALDLRPGSQFTVTLYYRVEGPTGIDYSRFVHLADPQLGMAAQKDSYPLEGRNPTTSWVPGEVIRDPVRLTVPQDARPGEYSLTAGFYDLLADARRLPLQDANGRPVPNDEFELARLAIHE